MIAYTLYYGNGTGIADSKTFAYAPIDVNFTASCTIEQGISCNRILFGLEVRAYRRQHGNPSARKTFAEVIVRFTFQLEVDTRYKEGTETLSCRTFELYVQRMFRQSRFTVLRGNGARKHGSASTIRIGNGIFQ